jgi:ribonuclease P protein component
MFAAANRLRRHADYQRVYQSSRKRFSTQVSYFFLLREAPGASSKSSAEPQPDGPRIGLTVGRAMGKAVDRNRIKRRMREAVRRNLAALHVPVDVVLHPRRQAAEIEFSVLEQEVAKIFAIIHKAVEKNSAEPPQAAQ